MIQAKVGTRSVTRTSPLVASRTALLVVDMQKAFCIPGRDPQHPELGPACYFHRRLEETVISNQASMLRAARRNGAEVIFTVIESLTLDGRDRSLDHKLSGIHVPRGSEGAQMLDAIAPRPDEIVLPKTSSGVFNSTNIEYLLHNLGIEFLVVFGVVTDQCVDMAVRDAADRGFLVTMVKDASATFSAKREAAAVSAFGGYCRIVRTERVISELDASR